ncbi:MAG: GNAT family N-acetyltransferase [Rhizobiaceae bacterium]|nr:GNAT family N-acetyltransferase [Rhizobiaceae bacterium]
MDHRKTNIPPGAVIRQLRPSDRQRFADHLLRLDARGRRDRFNGGLSDAFLIAYAQRCFGGESTVVGLVVGNDVLGAAEIHEVADEPEPTAEIAFSVEPGCQHSGIGTLLFERLLAHARAQGYAHLTVTTHANNHAMRRLAARFGASLRFRSGETVGTIHLAPLLPLDLPAGIGEAAAPGAGSESAARKLSPQQRGFPI